MSRVSLKKEDVAVTAEALSAPPYIQPRLPTKATKMRNEVLAPECIVTTAKPLSRKTFISMTTAKPSLAKGENSSNPRASFY